MSFWVMLEWHISMLVACLIACVFWKGSIRLRATVLAVSATLAVAVAWLPLSNFPTYWLAFAVPLFALLIGLMRRGGGWRWGAGVPSACLVAGLAYVGAAVAMSSARFPMDGIAYLPMFTTAKKAVVSNLNDPDSAVFRDLRLSDYHGRHFICGQVNARNRMGGLVGFTDFYVPVNDVLPFPTFVDSDNPSSRLTYMRTCYGDDWDKL